MPVCVFLKKHNFGCYLLEGATFFQVDPTFRESFTSYYSHRVKTLKKNRKKNLVNS